jgi:hypothetical protein
MITRVCSLVDMLELDANDGDAALSGGTAVPVHRMFNWLRAHLTPVPPAPTMAQVELRLEAHLHQAAKDVHGTGVGDVLGSTNANMDDVHSDTGEPNNNDTDDVHNTDSVDALFTKLEPVVRCLRRPGVPGSDVPSTCRSCTATPVWPRNLQFRPWSVPSATFVAIWDFRWTT